MQHKSILITGCSSGIGLNAATTLKKRGYRVFACARQEADVAALTAQGFESFQLDVNNTASMEQALTNILNKTHGTLDALFNNAGFLQAGAIEDLPVSLIRAQFETNFFGVIELTRRVLPIMRKQGYGRIIQNSSILGIITIPYNGAYNASKFALEGFSNTLRQELRGTNIKVAILNPGATQSRLRKNAFDLYQHSIGKQKENVYKAVYQRLEKTYFKNEQANRGSLPADAVTKQLVHALESKHPKAHYYIGFTAQMMAFFRRVLPDKAIDWMTSKAQ